LSDTLALLGFLGLFHLIGGIVAGSSLRRGIHQGWSCNLIGAIFWGIAFGGFPLFIGVTGFMRMRVPYIAGVELLIFVGAFLAATLMPDWIPEIFNVSALLPILFGGVFMVIGVILFMAIAGDSLPYALFALGAFGGSGAVVFVTSAVRALRG
jgi:hypothetical protein